MQARHSCRSITTCSWRGSSTRKFFSSPDSVQCSTTFVHFEARSRSDVSPHLSSPITPAMNRTDRIHYIIPLWATRQTTYTHALGLHCARKGDVKGGAKEGPVMSCCFRICRLSPAWFESMQRMYAGAKERLHTALGA
jgi:hypothetical protein